MITNPSFIDLELLCADIAGLAARSKALKAVLRRRWTKLMAEPQRELCQLRRRLTELYAVRAHCRGRVHRRIPPAGAPATWDAWHEQARVVERLAPQYVASSVRSA